MRILGLIILATATAPTAAQERVDPACEQVRKFRLFCASTAIGAVAADTQADADRMKVHAVRGEQRFRRFLGVEPATYLFIAGTGERYYAAARAVDRTASLNWPSAAQRMDPVMLRQSAQKSLANIPMSDAERSKAIDSFVAANSSTKAEQDMVDAIAIGHELTHVWFTRAFWPKAPISHDDYYAGPGPDWLDEGVTQIMESNGAAPYPFAKYREAISGAYAIRPGELAGILVEEHPGQKMKKVFAGRAFIPSAESKALGLDPPRFYVRSAAVTAFILAQSGNERVLAEIARAYADGTGFETWLGRNGKRYRLGTTVTEMEGLLLGWLARQGKDVTVSGKEMAPRA